MMILSSSFLLLMKKVKSIKAECIVETDYQINNKENETTQKMENDVANLDNYLSINKYRFFHPNAVYRKLASTFKNIFNNYYSCAYYGGYTWLISEKIQQLDKKIITIKIQKK